MTTAVLQTTAATATPVRCPACDGEQWTKIVRQGERSYYRCPGCGLEKLHPCPTLSELQEHYRHSYTKGLYREFVDASPMKKQTALARFNQAKGLAAGGRWLDVGCSDGTFLEVLREHGIEGDGVEVCDYAADLARSRGFSVFCGEFEAYDNAQRYDVISAFDVLEHVADPGRFLRNAARLLNPGGAIVLSAPNLRSFSRAIMRSGWYFYIPEEHLHLFTPGSIRKLATRCGFERVRVRPTYKPLTFDYSLLQLKEYAPPFHRLVKPLSWIVPGPLRRLTLPLYIGELMLVARVPQLDRGTTDQ